MSYADWAYAQFGFVKPYIRRLSTPLTRKWTVEEAHRVRVLYEEHADSGPVARAMRRDRDDIRHALHILGMRDFVDTVKARSRMGIPATADYYDALLPPVPPVYSTYTRS